MIGRKEEHSVAKNAKPVMTLLGQIKNKEARRMVFGLFKKKDPICGMKQEKGKGTEKHGKWFCSDNCLKKYEDAVKDSEKETKSCCCG